ncbi:T9SS type B sorting domain-containing protein [Vaginella massiliensis]|uniref:T9SS type B sorting domain-containing protein n=1 Tax=Vaginella massiliensis TaxID=1816680 RepID=UPI003752968A
MKLNHIHIKLCTTALLALGSAVLYGQQMICYSSTKQYSVDKSENGGEGSTASTYTWKVLESNFRGDINLLTDSGNQISVDWGETSAGDYTLEVTENGICGDVTTQLKVMIEESIAITLPPQFYLCPGLVTTLTAPAGYDNYQWYDANHNWIGEGAEIEVGEPGIYTVVVEKGSCSAEAQTEVILVEFPTFVVNTDLDNSIIIVASGGNSSVEYQLEHENGTIIYPWQHSNTFLSVPKGRYVVRIRSLNGDCLTHIALEAFILPNAITPNGDNKNDTWDLSKHLTQYPEAVIEIYDRYGRKLIEITAKDNFIWDGKVNGHALPTDSYWYLIRIDEKQTKSGSILLKYK